MRLARAMRAPPTSETSVFRGSPGWRAAEQRTASEARKSSHGSCLLCALMNWADEKGACCIPSCQTLELQPLLSGPVNPCSKWEAVLDGKVLKSSLAAEKPPGVEAASVRGFCPSSRFVVSFVVFAGGGREGGDSRALVGIRSARPAHDCIIPVGASAPG